MAKAKSEDKETAPPPTPARRASDVTKLAACYAKTMVEVLVSIACDPDSPAAARVAAAKEVLERGYGRAAAHVNLDGNQRVTHQSASLSDTAVWLAELLGKHGHPAPSDPLSN